jgi:hypothetical protein
MNQDSSHINEPTSDVPTQNEPAQKLSSEIPPAQVPISDLIPLTDRFASQEGGLALVVGLCFLTKYLTSLIKEIKS